MKAIASDRELLERLGLSEAQAADYLDRSRQTINAALGGDKPRSGYLKPSEILLLRLAAHSRGHDVDIEAVSDYVRRHYEKSAGAVAKVREAFGLLASDPELDDVKEAWVVLPDFAHLRKEQEDLAEMLARLSVRHPQCTIVYLVSNSLQKSAITDFVRTVVGCHSNLARVHFVDETVVGAQPTMIIAEPRGADPAVYILAPAGFTRIEQINAPLLAAYLTDLSSDLRAVPAPGAASSGRQ